MANEQRTIKVGGCGWKEGNMKFKHKLRLMVGKYQSIKPISQQMGKSIQTLKTIITFYSKNTGDKLLILSLASVVCKGRTVTNVSQCKSIVIIHFFLYTDNQALSNIQCGINCLNKKDNLRELSNLYNLQGDSSAKLSGDVCQCLEMLLTLVCCLPRPCCGELLHHLYHIRYGEVWTMLCGYTWSPANNTFQSSSHFGPASACVLVSRY